jgi:basic amino acid/polyamine antiporter, APA family
MPMTVAPAERPRLIRTLGLSHVVLYGLGVTVGAGIYVLVGEVISLSGDHAPVAFLIAGLVMLLPAACFAEFTGRLPFAAAEAHFVRAGFNSSLLFLLVGLGVAAVGIVSSAAIAHGSAGYAAELVALPYEVLLVFFVVLSGIVASLGVRQSILVAGLLTLIEVGGLLLLVGGALWSGADFAGQAAKAVPLSLSPALWAGIFGSSLLAFFAFIGFEDIDSIAEETINPQKTLPRGIFLTLAITLVLYILVVLAALATVSIGDLSGSRAPLAIVFDRTTGLSPVAITVIAVLATVNGIIVQIVMAGRVIYGLANEGALPKVLARVNATTHTPVIATVIATLILLVLTLAFTITALAQWTSIITLAIFLLVCIALARIKHRNDPAPAGTFIVSRWVPYGGALACLALLALGVMN